MTLGVFWKRRTIGERFLSFVANVRDFVFGGISRATPFAAESRAYEFTAQNRSEAFDAKERNFIFYHDE